MLQPNVQLFEEISSDRASWAKKDHIFVWDEMHLNVASLVDLCEV